MCQPRGSAALLSTFNLQINPLCQELGTELSALTQEASKCISFHRQEQNGVARVNCSGSSFAFCLGLTITGLIIEHVSSQGFSNIYRMYLVAPANNSPIGPQIECERLRHSCSGCYFAALLHNAERLLSSCKRVRDRETDCRGSRSCYFRKHCFIGGIKCFLQPELCEVHTYFSSTYLLKLRMKSHRSG